MPAYLVFIGVYLLVYGALNFYCWRKLRHLFQRQLFRLLFKVWFALQLAAPMLARGAEHNGWLLTAKLIAWPGYLWMGFAFIFFVIALLLDVLAGLLIYLRRRRQPAAPPAPGRARIHQLTGSAAGGLALLVALYGAYAARQVQVEQFTIPTAKLPLRVQRLRLVQISDLHISVMTDDNWVRGIIARVQQLQPDLVLATGDMADGDMAVHRELADAFAALKPRYGKFAVTGNHEFYSGLPQALAWLDAAGFQILRGESGKYDMLNIAGVDDYGHDSEARRLVDERELLATLPRAQFTLLLRHRPDVPPATIGLFDLQLSGHTHRGQIFPFNFIASMVTGRETGWHDLGSGSQLYVSRGTGTWGPPLRVLAPPEITVFDLIRE